MVFQWQEQTRRVTVTPRPASAGCHAHVRMEVGDGVSYVSLTIAPEAVVVLAEMLRQSARQVQREESR